MPSVVAVPVAEHADAVREPRVARSGAGTPALPRLLIVDDEPGLLGTLRLFVPRLGYEVRTAPDGTEALHHIRTGWPQCVLLDQQMPGATGLEILHHLHATAPHVRAVLMSGALDTELQHAATRLGAKACLQKPFGLHALAEALERALRAG